MTPRLEMYLDASEQGATMLVTITPRNTDQGARIPRLEFDRLITSIFNLCTYYSGEIVINGQSGVKHMIQESLRKNLGSAFQVKVVS